VPWGCCCPPPPPPHAGGGNSQGEKPPEDESQVLPAPSDPSAIERQGGMKVGTDDIDMCATC
jgi:hypothetical protein